MRNNHIQRLPRQITSLKRLKTGHVEFDGNPVWNLLDWGNQGFSTYPGTILSHFTALSVLRLGYNQITDIPPSIGKLQNLKTLLLQNNSIHQSGLSKNIMLLTKLEKVSVAFNPVAISLHWPNIDFANSEILRILRMLGNTIRDLDLSAGKLSTDDATEIFRLLPHLEQLNVSNNKLNSLTFGDIEFKSTPLRMIDLSENPVGAVLLKEFYNLNYVQERGSVSLRKIDSFVFSVFDEKEIGLSENFPSELIGQYFEGNAVQHVLFRPRRPSSWQVTLPLCQLKNGVARVVLKFIPQSSIHCLENLTSMKVLMVDEMELTRFDFSKLTGLVALTASRNELISVDLQKLTQLSLLKLSHNKLVTIDIENLIGLHQLSLDNNRLTSINVSHLTGLQVLSLPTNEVTYVDVSHLTQLTYLDLKNNKLTSINVSHLTGLQVLSLHTNEITHVDVSHLTQLTRVRLGNNKLTSINVSRLAGLQSLKLANNHFNASVPSTYSKLTHLTCLNLRNNNFKGNLRWIEQLSNLQVLDLRSNNFLGNFSLLFLQKLRFLGIRGSGIELNATYVKSILPHLSDYGDHFQTSDFQNDREDWCV